VRARLVNGRMSPGAGGSAALGADPCLSDADRGLFAEVWAGSRDVRYRPSLRAERDVFTEVTASVKVCLVFTVGGEPGGRPVRITGARRRAPH